MGERNNSQSSTRGLTTQRRAGRIQEESGRQREKSAAERGEEGNEGCKEDKYLQVEESHKANVRRQKQPLSSLSEIKISFIGLVQIAPLCALLYPPPLPSVPFSWPLLLSPPLLLIPHFPLPSLSPLFFALLLIPY